MLETLDLTTEIGLSAERPTWIELIRPIGPNANASARSQHCLCLTSHSKCAQQQHWRSSSSMQF
jgi:hypothetical protein